MVHRHALLDAGRTVSQVGLLLDLVQAGGPKRSVMPCLSVRHMPQAPQPRHSFSSSACVSGSAVCCLKDAMVQGIHLHIMSRRSWGFTSDQQPLHHGMFDILATSDC